MALRFKGIVRTIGSECIGILSQAGLHIVPRTRCTFPSGFTPAGARVEVIVDNRQEPPRYTLHLVTDFADDMRRRLADMSPEEMAEMASRAGVDTAIVEKALAAIVERMKKTEVQQAQWLGTQVTCDGFPDPVHDVNYCGCGSLKHRKESACQACNDA